MDTFSGTGSGSEFPLAPSKPRRARWVAAITCVVLGLGALAAWAVSTPDALAFYKTPSEIGDATADQRLRVGGRMVGGTLDRDGTLTRFTITDGTSEIDVIYDGEVPDTLKDGTDVIAEGYRSADGLDADRVLAKCSSKFVPVDKPEHLGRT